MMRAYRVLTKANMMDLAEVTGRAYNELKEMLAKADKTSDYIIFWRDRGVWKWIQVNSHISLELVVDQIGAARS